MVDYRDFKRRFLKPGLAILNGHPALNHTVELKEELSGRKVMRLRFKFQEKRQASFDLPLGWPTPAIKQLEEIGFSEKDIGTLSQLYPYDQVLEALKRLPTAEQRVRTTGSRVYSRKAFFNGILGNVAKGETQSAEEEAKLLKDAEQRQVRDEEIQRMDAMTNKFKAHQRSLIEEALQALPAEQQSSLFSEHQAADPGARTLFKNGRLGPAYLLLFANWLATAKPELFDSWLPEPKDKNMQSWSAWRLTLLG